MKKIISTVLLLIFSINFLFGQEEATTENLWSSNIKSVFAEVGYSSLKLTAALGFRFWNVGLSLGLAGFAASKPNYAYPSQQYPRPKEGEYEEYKFTYALVTTEAYYFFEIFDDFIITPSIGFFVQQDSVLARSLRYYEPYKDFGVLYYLGKTQNKTGVTFGLGVDYYYDDKIIVGLGYNYRRGVFLRLSYYWY